MVNTRVNILESDGGKVDGHTSRNVKSDEALLLTFVPDSGNELAGVVSSCGGTLEGATFSIAEVSEDCTVEPVFQTAAVVPGDTLKRC